MGAVYRAFDTQLERDVALKVLPPHRVGRELFQRRLQLESKLLAKLQHPNIVTVYEAGNLEEVRFIVMEIIEGISLDELIGDFQDSQRLPQSGKDLFAAVCRPLPTGRPALFDGDCDIFLAIATIMREIVHGIEAAHGQGIMHRDIKPGNIMLNGGLHPVILDFGLAGSSQVPAGNVTEKLFGSVPYLAPEQLQHGQIGFDVRTDIYQLGLILYELLVMRRAFPDDSVNDAIDNIRNGQFVRPRKIRKEIPKDLESICIKAVEQDPSRRYVTARELGDDLDRFLAGRPTIASPPSVIHQASLFMRRNRRIVTAVVLALVLGIAGSYWLLPASEILLSTDLRVKRLPQPPSQSTPYIEAGALVYDGDQLFLEIDLKREATVLALSVVGTRKKHVPDFIIPLEPRHIPAKGQEQIENSNKYSLRLPAGLHTIQFAEIVAGDAQGTDQWYEGLWIFYSSSPCTWLCTAMKALQAKLPAEGVAPGLAYDVAKGLLVDAAKGMKVRGRRTKAPSPEELERLQDFFKTAKRDKKDSWLLPGLGVFEVYFLLDRK